MNERNNTTVLPEFTVTAKRKNPKKVIPTESESNFFNRINVAKEDERINKNIKKEIKSNRTKIQNYSDEVDKLLKDIDFVSSRKYEILNNKRFSIKKEKRRTKKYRIAAGLISSGLGIAGEELIRRNLED